MTIVDFTKILPQKGSIHFVGIGGIGMSAIATILNHMGYKVQGSDISDNQNVARLKKEGVKIYLGHSIDHLDGVSLCVRSSIIKDDNVEIKHCKAKNISIVHRSDILAQLMKGKYSIAVSGTHGKTTTTALVASVLEAGDLDPTVINGGIISNKNTNAYLGKSNVIVSEADESDNSFIKLPANIAVITNIDSEHLDFYGSYDNLKKSFFKFIDQLPDKGFGVVGTDNLEVQELLGKLPHKELVTYGFDGVPDLKAINLKPKDFGYSFDVVCSDKFNYQEIKGLRTNIPGEHNVKNSLAAVAIALKLSIPKKFIIDGLANYTGVKRRFTVTGKEQGITFVDDYAHHPEEIIATLSAAKNILAHTGGKLFVVFQPHKYTRLRDLFDRFVDSFKNSDALYIADVYAASESPINGSNSESLVGAIKKKEPDADVHYLKSLDLLPGIIRSKCKENDIVMFLGAGDITKWAYEVPSQING